jgi:hypothetical protein
VVWATEAVVWVAEPGTAVRTTVEAATARRQAALSAVLVMVDFAAVRMGASFGRVGCAADGWQVTATLAGAGATVP